MMNFKRKRILLLFIIILVFYFLYNKPSANNEILVNMDQNDLFHEYDSKYESDKLLRLITLLYKINAFVIDVDFLKLIKLNQNSSFYNFKNAQQFSKHTSKNLHLTFAVPTDQIDKIKDLKNRYNIIADRLESYGNLNGKQVLTNVYLTWSGIRIQLVLSYKRGDFLWFGEDENKTEITKWFGDVPRAMNNIETAILSDKHLNLMWIPSNIDKFFFDYEHSRFIECNHTMAETNLKLNFALNHQDKHRNLNTLRGLNHLKKVIEGMYKKYWIAAGGLLGWYRNCGIIPFTTDIDIAMWIEDYEVKLKKALLGNTEVWLWKTLGTLEKGFEMRLYSDLFDFDLFFVYRNNTHQWNGYQIDRRQHKQWLYSFDELCSCEMVDSKFLIPCEPVKYLSYQYGDISLWSVPQEKNYQRFNFQREDEWSDTDWVYAIRYYDRFGKVERLRTLKKLNEFSKTNITTLPLEDIEIDYID